MPTNTSNFSFYKPDIGQRDGSPEEWGTPMNNNLDKIDRLFYYRAFLPFWGLPKPSSPSQYDDEFDDQFFDTSKWLQAGSTNYTATEDGFNRLKLSKGYFDNSLVYLYQSFTAPSLSDGQSFFVQVCMVNNNASRFVEDCITEAGIYFADSTGGSQYNLLVWSNIFDNLVRIYQSSYHSASKGTEIYNYNYGRINRPLFFRGVFTYDAANTSWDLMFQMSLDGLHWRNLKYVDNALSATGLDTIGIIFADYNPQGDPDNVFSSFYHFRVDFSPNSNDFF